MRQRFSLRLAALLAAALSTTTAAFTLARVQETKPSDSQTGSPVPVLLQAAVPVYPMVCRSGNVQGVVTVTIGTDGTKAQTIHVESGPKLLADVVIENVRTWKFLPHRPAKLRATFRYELDREAECSPTNGTVFLRLPAETEIRARRLAKCEA